MEKKWEYKALVWVKERNNVGVTDPNPHNVRRKPAGAGNASLAHQGNHVGKFQRWKKKKKLASTFTHLFVTQFVTLTSLAVLYIRHGTHFKYNSCLLLL